MKPTYNFLIIITLMLLSNISFSQSVPSYVPTNGLVGWWGFNGNAQDGSGNGNHGTVNGATLTTDRFGNQNSAYSYDGINDFIEVVNNSNLQYLNSFSISLWYKINQWEQIGSNFWFATIEKPASYSLQLKKISLDSAIVALTDIYHNELTWNNLVITFANNILKTYSNGVLMDSVSTSFNSSNQSIFFGKDPGGLLEFTNGLLDDIGFWNRALSPQEITNLYNSQLPTQTSLCLPTITTSSPSSVGLDTVVIGGDISNDGGSSIVLRGICYSTSPNPNMGNQRTEDGSGIGSFNTVLRGLNPSTTYYAKSYAKNSNGVVVYGNEVSFTTSASLPGVRCPGTPTVTDIDGNIYNTVQIGNQCWTQSNLKVSKYRNGDSIPTGLNNSQRSSTTSGAYAIYNNDPVNDGLYGKLYNHYAVTDSRGLCPTGWHVPSDAEWTTLENYLGGSYVAGGSMKNTAKQPTPGGWASPNTGATNSSGFTALSGGLWDYYGDFGTMTNYGFWWSSSVLSGADAWFRYLNYGISFIFRDPYYRTLGFSVRCLKD